MAKWTFEVGLSGSELPQELYDEIIEDIMRDLQVSLTTDGIWIQPYDHEAPIVVRYDDLIDSIVGTGKDVVDDEATVRWLTSLIQAGKSAEQVLKDNGLS